MKLYFNINYGTKMGEKLQMVVLEKNLPISYHDLYYTENNNWVAEIEFLSKNISYKYQVVNNDGHILDQEFETHQLNFSTNFSEFFIYDVWNLKNFPENYLNNKILQNQLPNFKPEKVSILKKHTHLFRVEAPLYHQNWKLALIGNALELGNWDYKNALLMSQTELGVWELGVTIKEKTTILYKYAIYNTETQEILDLEYGANRWVYPNLDPKALLIKADHFFKFKSFELYHAAGVAVPVFSLRTEQGFGVGEFPDIKKLADWAKNTHLSILQFLPINDTSANFSWTDSYPYAAISIYALHPLYLSLDHLTYNLPSHLVSQYEAKKAELNQLQLIDYEAVMLEKWVYLKETFNVNEKTLLKDKKFNQFIKENKHWLYPYAAFCLLRDQNKTPNFNLWKTNKKYSASKISAIFSPKHKDYTEALLHCWIQYELHLQLKEAIDYAHSLSISIKGDLPIGIYRYSVEAWTEPELFGMDFQAGAPPDQFSDLGQNWGFPTYNWEAMKADGYLWWKNRFKALEQYFDAMRIDHILGFFRIWRIPMSATEGILGYFYPAIPVTLKEFKDRKIPFNEERFCKPYLNDQILWDYFAEEKDAVVSVFLDKFENNTYAFKEAYNTQRKLKDFFDKNPHHNFDHKLISLCANVLFLKEEKENGAVYHPRFNISKTDSFKYLSETEKIALEDLYVDYFFKRQDGLWYQSAMEKLPVILNSTKMLICGEDLGMVPETVPEVMDSLGIAALKVQRMPKENVQWYNPKDASYLNVVTASSHDSSTLRQWWHENRSLTHLYFNQQLSQWGTAPWDLEPGIAEIIMKQHLFNDAMLAIFPIQEFFATDPNLTNPYMDNERINEPSVFPHYWRYRMHLDLEYLIHQKDFNQKIASWVDESGRN